MCSSAFFQEAIYHEVAILGIPLLYEQKMNAELIKKHNLGVVVDFSELNEQSFSDALVRLQQSQRTIQKSVTSLAHRVKDSRTTPLQVTRGGHQGAGRRVVVRVRHSPQRGQPAAVGLQAPLPSAGQMVAEVRPTTVLCQVYFTTKVTDTLFACFVSTQIA